MTEPAKSCGKPPTPSTGVRRIPLRPETMIDPVTRTEDVLVLAHLGIPAIEPDDWSVSIDGLVHHRLALNLEDLRRRPKRVVEAVHQCCGNPLEPDVPTRRVTNVRWGGAALTDLLNEAGVKVAARFVWSYGCDRGTIGGESVEAYAKDLPLERLDLGDVLVAYELNDAPLSAEHGFPARLVVPGYYGTNCVKWLSRLHLAAERMDSIFTTRLYNDVIEQRDGMRMHQPVWAIQPEAIIVSPAPDRILRHHEPVEIWGWAWSCQPIVGVEVSTDGGRTWLRATVARRQDWAWQRFSFTWRPQGRGITVLHVRATDADGRTQPPDRARNAVHSVGVVVR